MILSIVAFLAIVGMLNYLAHRHNSRFYLSRSASQKLSPLTLSVLKSLTNTVRVTVFFNRNEPLFNSVASLIEEYGARSKKLEIEFIDYRMPGRAETIRNQYKLSPGGDSSRIIFDINGETRTVLGSELSDYDISRGRKFAGVDSKVNAYLLQRCCQFDSNQTGCRLLSPGARRT